MRRVLAVTILVLAGLFALPEMATADCSARSTTDDPRAYFVNCGDHEAESANDSTSASFDAAAGPADGTTYEYLWLPNCPTAQPHVAGSQTMDCTGAHTCDDPEMLSMRLYTRRLTDETGVTVDEDWQYSNTDCRGLVPAGPTVQRRTLTTADILSAIRRIGLPGATVEGPAYTLVNLDTTFYSRPADIDRTLTMIGYTVDVHITPARYTWHWGDGTTTTSHTPGRPYPATDITHTYRHATDPAAPRRLSVHVTYTARYRVDGGTWQTIPAAITIPGPPRDLPIKHASAVLVAQD